jgi:hypothetical protein
VARYGTERSAVRTCAPPPDTMLDMHMLLGVNGAERTFTPKLCPDAPSEMATADRQDAAVALDLRSKSPRGNSP